MKNNQPLITVIIVNYNGSRLLEVCLNSLLETEYPKNKIELVMVDNGSSDDSVKFVKRRFPSVNVLINKTNNYCQANNLAILSSKAKYVALLNNDTKVEKHWLKELVQVIDSDKSIAAVGSKLLLPDGRIQNAGHVQLPDFYWAERGFGEEESKFSKEEEVASLCGAAVLYRRDAVVKAGLLDEDFIMYMEDVDLAFRLRKKGEKIIFVPKSLVYHEFHGTGNEELSRFYIERNRLLFIAKHDPEKLKDGLLGRGHFTVSKGQKSLGALYEILPDVILKVIKHHGLTQARQFLTSLSKGIETVVNYENNILIKEAEILKQKIEGATSESATKEAEVLKLQSELAATKQSIRQAQEELSLARDAFSQTESKLTQVIQELEESKAQAEKIKKAHFDVQEELVSTKRILLDSQIELAQIKDTFIKTNEELTEIKSDLAIAKQSIQDYQDEISLIKDNLSETESKLGQSLLELSESKSQTDKAKKELSEIQTELLSTEQKFSDSQAELSSVQSKLVQSENELALAKDEAARAKTELEKANSVKSKTIAELRGIYSSQGFRFILRPLWTVLWQLKLIFKGLSIHAPIIMAAPVFIANLILFPVFLLEFIFWSIIKPFVKKNSVAKPFNKNSDSKISIVIPNYNGKQYLEKGLNSIFALKEFQSFGNEVIVVDDASSDGSQEYLKQNFPQVNVIPNLKNSGFGEACNKGIRAANNELVILLNNDIVVSEDFVKPLLDHLKEDDVFAASPKLYAWDKQTFATGMYAGEFKNGYVNIWNESGVCPEPKINRAAPQMFAIGCAMCFRKNDFLELGGFDNVFRPYCWEDIDISYQALKRGKRVIYEPKSVAYHKIHGTIGNFNRRIEIKNELLFIWKNITDLDLVIKHLLISPFHFINKKEKPADFLIGYFLALLQLPKVLLRRFTARKYAGVSDKEIFSNTKEFFSYYRKHNGNNDKKNLLLLTPFLPYPLKSGGQVKMYNTISRLSKDYNLILLSFIEREEQRKYVKELLNLCSRVEVVLRRPKPHLRFRKMLLPVFIKYFYVDEMKDKLFVLLRDYEIDLVQIEYMNMSYYAKFIPGPPKVLIEHDTSIYNLNDSYDKPAFGRASLILDWLIRRNYQKKIYRYFDKIVAFTEEDAKVVTRACPREKVSIIPIAVNSSSYKTNEPYKKDIDILFVGHMLHFPNEDGLKYFIRDIFPLIKKELPKVNFKIIGSNIKDIHLNLKNSEGIEVIGEVEDVLPYLLRSKVMVVPIRLGAGIKVKILESMAAGVAVVATQKAAKGLKSKDAKDLLVGNGPLDFAKKVTMLLRNDFMRQELTKNAQELIQDQYDSTLIDQLEKDFYRKIIPATPKAKVQTHGPKIVACWDILLRCNYRCPYCFNHGKWDDLEKHNRPYTHNDWFVFWERMKDKYGEISIVISGGEPFIYPRFLELLKKLVQMHKVEVCTNLSFDVNKITEEFSPDRLILHPSFHPYFADLDEFIEKLKILKSSGWLLGPIIVAYPPLLSKITYFKERFKERGIDVFIQPFVGRYEDKEYPQAYTSDERRGLYGLVDTDLTKCQLQGLNPKGALCSAGSRYFRVHPDGSIFRCAAAGKVLGRIEDKNFKLLGGAFPCEAEFCICNSEAVYLQDFSKIAVT